MDVLEIQQSKQPMQADVKLLETKLQDTLRGAYASPLYRNLWKAASFTPGMFQSLNDYNKIPFLNREELFEATRTKQSKICIGRINNWFLGYDDVNKNEWFPYSQADLIGIAPMLARMSQTVGLQEGDIVLAVVDTPPTISSLIPYLWSYWDSSRHCKIEFIMGSMDWYDTLSMSWINFIQKRRPVAIFTSTKNAKALAEKIQAMNNKVREVLSDTRVGIFYGNSSEQEMTQVLGLYSNLESFRIYSPSEHMFFCSECSSHSGIHLWLDKFVAELIPNGRQEAQPIGEVTPGTKGELVITNFHECLPLIRYKTGSSVRIEGIDKCACGSTHPRVSICER